MEPNAQSLPGDKRGANLVATVEVHTGTTRVVLAGEIDLATGPLVRSSIDEALRVGTGRLEIDVHAVTFMDSTALGILAVASDRVATRGGSILVCGASPMVRRLFEVSGLDAAVEVV